MKPAGLPALCHAVSDAQHGGALGERVVRAMRGIRRVGLPAAPSADDLATASLAALPEDYTLGQHKFMIVCLPLE